MDNICIMKRYPFHNLCAPLKGVILNKEIYKKIELGNLLMNMLCDLRRYTQTKEKTNSYLVELSLEAEDALEENIITIISKLYTMLFREAASKFSSYIFNFHLDLCSLNVRGTCYFHNYLMIHKLLNQHTINIILNRGININKISLNLYNITPDDVDFFLKNGYDPVHIIIGTPMFNFNWMAKMLENCYCWTTEIPIAKSKMMVGYRSLYSYDIINYNNHYCRDGYTIDKYISLLDFMIYKIDEKIKRRIRNGADNDSIQQLKNNKKYIINIAKRQNYEINKIIKQEILNNYYNMNDDLINIIKNYCYRSK